MPPETGTVRDEEGLAPAVVEEAILGLTRLWSDARLYSLDHPVIAERLAEVRERLLGPLNERGELVVKRVGHDLIYGSQRLFRCRARPMGLVGTLDRFGVGCLTVRDGVTEAELRALCTALGEKDSAEGVHGVQEYLAREGADHIAVGGLVVSGSGGATLLTRTSPRQLYDSAMQVAREIAESARLGQPIDVTGARAATTEIVGAIAQDPGCAVGLACLRGHDQYTFAHSVHATLLSVALGDFIGFTEEELHGLGLAAMLHDVGKVAVPIEILRKPGRLSDAEWEVVSRHPVEGATMLLDNAEVPASVPVVAFEHHLRADLSGYPKLTSYRGLSLLSLIVSLADVYDALTTHRPYRPPMSPEQALAEILQMASSHLDPRLVDWFRAMLGVYPPGTCVALDTGELAVVCGANHQQSERPWVAIVTDADGLPLEAPRDADLTETRDGRHVRSVRCSVSAAEAGVEPSQVIEGWIERSRPVGD